ncbi:MAG: YdeI/OmpD-associated family protein [Nocardioidaceae bacterium]
MTGEDERVEVTSREQARDWFAAHHADTTAVWLVTYKKGRGPHVGYDDLVEEALCVGWVDTQGRRVDDERTSLRLTPRRARSAWSRSNKDRVTRLRAAGLMRPAGEAVVAQAVANGCWTALDEVEALVEPVDLRAALDAVPAARTQWQAFPPTARRALLEWISVARTAPTRERRVQITVSEAAEGRRANHRP